MNTVTINKQALDSVLRAQMAFERSVLELLNSLTFEPIPQNDEWISTSEVKEITGISKTKLCLMARNGECIAKRVGSDWRFPKSKVQNMTFIVNDTAVSR